MGGRSELESDRRRTGRVTPDVDRWTGRRVPNVGREMDKRKCTVDDETKVDRRRTGRWNGDRLGSSIDGELEIDFKRSVRLYDDGPEE